MLYYLSTFIQAVCTRSLTSFALFTATLKHSCSLSSTRGDPPWRKKKQQCYEEFSQPPSLQWLKLLLNIVLAYKMVAVVVVAIELCWRVKVFFFACPKIVRSPKHMLPGLWTAAILSSSVITTVTIPVTRFSSSSVGSANNTVLQGKKEINVCWISQLSQDITLLSSVENASC